MRRIISSFAVLLCVYGSPVRGDTSGLPPVNVVLVHGFLDNGRLFDPMIHELEKAGCRCFAPSLQPNDGSSGIDDLTQKLSARIDAHFGARASFFMVGFSMGGIVTRDYVEHRPAGHRILGVFLISTGSRGTFWARLSPNAHQRELASGSRFLAALNADDSAWKHIPLHAYWTPLDLMIVPSVNTRWPAGKTTRVVCALHPWMVRNRVVIADIGKRMLALRKRQPPGGSTPERSFPDQAAGTRRAIRPPMTPLA